MSKAAGYISDYLKDYPELNFRVSYSYNTRKPEEISFAAQPYEFILFDEEGYEPNTFYMYGKMNFDMKMTVGFKGFSVDMTKDLHKRIGLIYEAVEKELLEKYSEGG